MTRKRITLLFTVSIAVGIMALSVSTAEASFKLKFDDLVGATADLVVTDGLGLDVNATAGAITVVSLPYGGFTFTVAAGTSKPVTGSAAAPRMVLSITATSEDTAGSNVRISLTDTGFTSTPAGLTPAGFNMGLVGIGLTSSSTVTMASFADGGDVEFGMAEVFPVLTATLALDTDSGSGSVASLSAPFSLTLELDIDGPSAFVGGEIIGTPEPASLAVWAGLAGLGLLGAGWRKRRKQIAA